jgi:hypothetical protein
MSRYWNDQIEQGQNVEMKEKETKFELVYQLQIVQVCCNKASEI